MNFSSVKMACCRCGIVDVDYDTLLSWEEDQDISCQCGGELAMVAMCLGGPMEKTVRTVGGVREALDELLVVPGFAEGGVQ